MLCLQRLLSLLRRSTSKSSVAVEVADHDWTLDRTFQHEVTNDRVQFKGYSLQLAKMAETEGVPMQKTGDAYVLTVVFCSAPENGSGK